MLAVQVVNRWEDVTRAPLADGLPERPMFLCGVEIDHPGSWLMTDGSGYSRLTMTRAPRSRRSRSPALVELAASSRWSVLPNSAHTSSSPMSA